MGPEPRGLAITNDGDADDSDETLYVTQFLSLPVAGKVDGQDDAKAGHVTIVSTATNLVTGQVTINPIADTGFFAGGDAIARIPIGNPPVFNIQTGAYPNQLNNLAIKGDFVFVPNVGASPNGSLRFDVNTHSLLSRINRTTATDAGTINMHLAVKNQTKLDGQGMATPGDENGGGREFVRGVICQRREKAADLGNGALLGP